jgi:HEAT repeat protein
MLVAVLLGACASTPDPAAEAGSEKPPRIRVAREEAEPGTNFGRETSPELLFLQLDRQLRTYRDPGTNTLARQNMRPVLARYVDANFDLIAQALKGDNVKHRMVAAWALGYSRDPRAMPSLLTLLHDRSPKVRANALHGLATLGDPATPIKPVVVCFSDADASVRCNAARAVREILEPGSGIEVIVPLTGLLTDDDHLVRLAAVGALGKIGRPECLGFLISALQDEMPLIRSQAALALGKTGDPACVSSLIDSLKTEKIPVVVSAVVKALESLTGQSFAKRSEWIAWWTEQQEAAAEARKK